MKKGSTKKPDYAKRPPQVYVKAIAVMKTFEEDQWRVALKYMELVFKHLDGEEMRTLSHMFNERVKFFASENKKQRRLNAIMAATEF